jgi:L,D-transpeptidase ErfK/SrfK
MPKILCYLALFIASFMTSPTLFAYEYKIAQSTDIIGQVRSTNTHRKDTLYDIGMSHGIGFNEILEANPNTDAWLPGKGNEIVVPTEFILPSIREGVVINLDEYRLYFFPEDGTRVITYPVGIGTDQTPSPEVATRIKLKIKAPNWYPPESVRTEHYKKTGEELPRVIYPGPKNPLGPFAIQLDLPEYFIHGTNKSFGIGTKISRGCIRLANDHLSKFVEEVPKYTPVRFIREPVKVGVKGNDVFVEFHFYNKEDALDDESMDTIISRVGQIEKHFGLIKIDFLALRKAMKHASGLPQKIGTKQAALN